VTAGPGHGSLGAYTWRRCRCPACRHANSAYKARRAYLAAAGRWHPWAPAAPVRGHLRHLRAAGLTVRQIAAAAGVSETLVYGLLRGGSERLRRRQAAALVTVVPAPGAAGRLSGTALVPAAGTTRRLRALMVCRWPAAELARRLGVHPYTVRRLAAGQHRTSAAAAAGARVLYDDLWDRPGPSQRTRALALARGWAPPLAWDDDEIDDPAAAPQGIAASTGSGHGRVAALVEDSEELLAQGYTLAQAADRFGVSRNSLERARLRSGLRLSGGRDAA
jgi:AraC-like DNA-binding protein